MTKSRQPRFSTDQLKQIYSYIERWVKSANLEAPDYSVSSMPRDQWLRAFWPREPLWAGVLKSTMNIDKNRGWTLTGGRNQVNQYTKVLRDAEGGAGWRRYIGLQSLSYYTANIGAITELGFDTAGGAGPLRAIWHADPARCELTGKKDTPLRYYPPTGAPQDWRQDWYMRAVSMESTDEAMLGLGRCATDLALDLATIMVAIWNHDKEMLFARLQKGILLMNEITETQWNDAMVAQSEQLTAKEREFFGGLSIFFGAPGANMDAKLVALSQLWEGFTLGEWVSTLMSGYALIMGYDASEYWPIAYGAFSHGTETEVQAIKATGKGGLDFVLAYQDNFQRELPETLLFEFEQRNEQGDVMEAQVADSWGRAINSMAAPSGPGMAETLTVGEKRQLLAQHGLIPDEWTAEEEEETASDTDEAPEVPEERGRIPISYEIFRPGSPESCVMRASRAFPGETIVRYHWPSGTEQVIWKPPSISVRRGGPGSGNYGHAGRPGEVGGSGPGGDTVATNDRSQHEIDAINSSQYFTVIREGIFIGYHWTSAETADNIEGDNQILGAPWNSDLGYTKANVKNMRGDGAVFAFTSPDKSLGEDWGDDAVMFKITGYGYLVNHSEEGEQFIFRADEIDFERATPESRKTKSRRGETLYSNEAQDFAITNSDVDRAIKKWNRRQEKQYRGLLEAEAV
jgi:hypothetical protein